MKTNHWTKTISVLLLSLGLFKPASGFAQMLSVQSGSAIDIAQPAQPDSIVQIVADSQGLVQLAPADLPIIGGGTFWWVMPGGDAVPAPCLPLDLSGAVYQIADGQYLVDETGGQVGVNTRRFGLQAQATSSTVASEVASQADAVVNLITQVQTAAANQQARATMQAMGMDVPSPGDDGSDGGTNSYMSYGSSYMSPDYGTNLWIAQVSLSSGNLVGIMSNSLADVSYEIQSRTNLLQSNWNSEVAPVYGSETTNWTPLSVAMNNRANLFLRIRSLIDSANVGIPDWWQLQYFGYVGINPYAASPSGDGYTIWQKYQSGLNPTNFETPPAPNNFVAVLSTNGTNVLLSWDVTQGAVTNYSIVRGVYNPGTGNYDYSTIGTVNSSTTLFVDVGAIHNANDQYDVYELTADYPGGNTSETAYSYIYDTAPPPPPTPPAPAYNIYVSATLVRNATGRWQLMFAGLPSNVQTIRLYWNSTTQNISPAILTNGTYNIPDTDVVNYLGDTVSVQGIGANGDPGQIVQVGVLPNDAPYFVDGRRHMKQNLNFLIRGACPDLPYMGVNNMILSSGNYNQNSTNFEEFSFLHHGGSSYGEDPSFFQLDNLWPFSENYHLAYFILDTSSYTNVYPQDDITPAFVFEPNFATNIPTPPVLGNANPYWIIQPEFFFCNLFGPPYDPSLVGVDVPDAGYYAGYNTTVTLPNNTYNLFGLPYQTGCMITVGPNINYYIPPPAFHTLAPGGTDNLTPFEQTNNWRWKGYASQCPAPTLQFVNYYFAPLINPNANPMNLPGAIDYSGNNVVQYPTPLDDAFKVTNQTPTVMIGAVGQPMILGGWAKYSIQGSSPTKFAYLGQYFATNAFLLDGSGNVTTNTAGILSPYGEFFPTRAGQAQLVTMPDIDTGQQGTNIVQIISLNVDANHDGTMDLSYFGHDQTSPSKPYVFWCNNNCDRWHTVDGTDHEQDDMPPQSAPDCNYTVGGTRVIPCARDLEDFSRLWISGVTSNLLAALPYGSTVTLNWGDVSNPNSSNPTIDLFQAADTDGGIGYLTNGAIAAVQTNNNPVLVYRQARTGRQPSVKRDSIRQFLGGQLLHLVRRHQWQRPVEFDFC